MSDLQRSRRRVGWGFVLLVVWTVVWFFAPGLPSFWTPSASAEMKAAGQALFEHEWTPNDPLAGGDGLGPVFNAKSCVACHSQGGVGGGGPNSRNVTAFDVLPCNASPKGAGGLIHRFSVVPEQKETGEIVRRLFPQQPGTVAVFDNTSCSNTFPPFDPLKSHSINSTALFGGGWIDRISDRAISHNQIRHGLATIIRQFDLDFDSVPPGRRRILADGRVGKFGWRGQFATLREFVAAACANELGLGNPLMPQAKPLGLLRPETAKPDLDKGQFAVLVAFVDTLPRPIEVPSPEAAHGKQMFLKVGCAICHVPTMAGVEGIYSDLLLHQVEDQSPLTGYVRTPPAPLPDHIPRDGDWKTPPLWGVADSAPYFHDGGSPTLEAAILRHTADARSVTRAYRALPSTDQAALVSFLRSLKAPAVERTVAEK